MRPSRPLAVLPACLLLPLLLAGCPGTVRLFGPAFADDDDDSASQDDDDAQPDDDDVQPDDDDVQPDDDDVQPDDDDAQPDDDDAQPDDDDVQPDDDDVQPDDDDDDGPDVADCGPWVEPGGPDSVRVFSGDALLQLTSTGWTWTGCEVERFFDDGAFDCENLWNVSGEMIGWDDGDQAADYYLEFDYQGDIATSCGDAEDQEWRYLVDYDFGGGTLDLYWRNPGGGGSWNYWASTPFVIDSAQTQVEFDYVTEFMGTR